MTITLPINDQDQLIFSPAFNAITNVCWIHS